MHVNWKKQDTENHVFCDSIYRKCPGKANLLESESNCLAGAGVMLLTINVHKGSDWNYENFLQLDMVMVAQLGKFTKNLWMYTWNGWMLWCVNNTSISHLKNEW